MKKIIRKLTPSFIYSSLSFLFHKLLDTWRIKRKKPLQKRSLSTLKDKDKIRCVFFAIFEEVWKVDGVYSLMAKSDRFEPLILVCPVVNYGKDNMLQRMDQCYNFFIGKKYNVKKAYDKDTNKYIDVIKELSPDIIFYTNPYKGLIDNRYYIDKFPNVLTAYVPYFFHEGVNYPVTYDGLFNNLLWRRYTETSFHHKLAVKYNDQHGRNFVVSGYPGIEQLIRNDRPSDDSIWKVKDSSLKRIIWAPHHTLEAVGTCNYSCFLRYADYMVSLAEKYKDSVQFAFKPHPLLRNKLDLLWGKEKTGIYYKKWIEMPNTTLKEGDYIDLFLTSDAMIHDSGSFLIEYLYVNKPVMRTLNDIPLEKLYNPFALKCLEQYYFARKGQDIEQFIQDVINGADPLKEQRTKFVNDVLMPKGTPSQNIIDDILDSIDNQILYRN